MTCLDSNASARTHGRQLYVDSMLAFTHALILCRILRFDYFIAEIFVIFKFHILYGLQKYFNNKNIYGIGKAEDKPTEFSCILTSVAFEFVFCMMLRRSCTHVRISCSIPCSWLRLVALSFSVGESRLNCFQNSFTYTYTM